ARAQVAFGQQLLVGLEDRVARERKAACQSTRRGKAFPGAKPPAEDAFPDRLRQPLVGRSPGVFGELNENIQGGSTLAARIKAGEGAKAPSLLSMAHRSAPRSMARPSR